MSQPNVSRYMEQLLDGVEVEWKPLVEIGELVRGNGLPKKDFVETGIPAIHYGQIYTYYGLSTTSTISFVSAETAKKLRKVNKGDVVITNTSENLEDVGKTLVYLGEQQAVTGGHATIFKPSEIIIGKYFAYFSQTEIFAKEKRRYAKGAKVIDVSATDMAKIEIPIPFPDNPQKSLEIQAEIVRILDAFTAMTAELTAELNLRKKQYNYYRDLLLSEAELRKVGFEWKLLGEVSQYEQPTKYLVESTNYDDSYSTPVLTAGKTFILGYTDEDEGIYEASSDPVIIFDDFTTANKWVDFDFKAKSSAMKMITSADENGVLTKYIYYWLNTVPSGLVEGDHKRQWIQNYCNKKIPIPSLEEQARIVAILDKFDALTNSITEGLPREIELRQKQYEYYRDLLLSFPKPEADAAVST